MKTFLRSNLAALLVMLGHTGSFAQAPATMRLQAFAQGGNAKNCISVALIKAAIQRYGVGQVFDTLRTGSQVQVTLRDRTVLMLTDAERRQAAAWAKFKQPGNEEVVLPAPEKAAIVSYASFCYAVMAKYIATQKLFLCTNEKTNKPDSTNALGDYPKTLQFLTDTSICSDNAYRHLGLRATDATQGGQTYSRKQDFTGQAGVVAYSKKHAVFVLGSQYDSYGTWKPLAKRLKTDGGNFVPKWFFILN